MSLLAIQSLSRLMTVPFEPGSDVLTLRLSPVDNVQADVDSYDFLEYTARHNRQPDPRYILVSRQDTGIDQEVKIDYKVVDSNGNTLSTGTTPKVSVPAGTLRGSSFALSLDPDEGPNTRLLRLHVTPGLPGGQASSDWQLVSLMGNLARLFWVIGWEQDHIRRQMERVKTQRHLAEARGLSLDLFGYDLGVPRFPPLPHTVDADTIALYHLDDKPGATPEVEDITVRYGAPGHHGTNAGGFAQPNAPGRFGSAFAFRNPSAEIQIPDHADFNLPTAASFTVECFTKPDPEAQNTVISHLVTKRADPSVATQRGWALSVGEFGRGLSFNVRFSLSDGTQEVNVFLDESLPTSSFSHLAGVIDRQRNEIRLYLNGQLRASDSISGLNVLTNNQPVRFGSTAGAPFQGVLDEVRFSRRARTDFSPVLGENDASYQRRLQIFERWTLPTPDTLLTTLNAAVGEINGDSQPLVLNDTNSTLISGSQVERVVPKSLKPGECIDVFGNRRTKEETISGTVSSGPGFDPAFLVAHNDPRAVYSMLPARILAAGELPPDTHKMQVQTASALDGLLDLLQAEAVAGQTHILSAFDPRAGDLRQVGRAVLLAHSSLGLGPLAAMAHRAGFAFACWKPDLGGVYASTVPGDILSIRVTGGTATSAGGVDLRVGETLQLDVHPDLGAGAIYRWVTIACGEGRAEFTTRTDRSSVTLRALTPGELVVKVEVARQRSTFSTTRHFQVGLIELDNGRSIGQDGRMDVTESVAEGEPGFFHAAYLVTHNDARLTYGAQLNNRRMQPGVADRLNRLLDLIVAAGGTGTLQVAAAYDPSATPLSAEGRALTLRRNPSMTLTMGQVAALAQAAGFTYVLRQDPDLFLRQRPENLLIIQGPGQVAEGESIDLEIAPRAVPTGLTVGTNAMYTANSGTDTISEVDLQSGNVRRALKVGWRPTAVALSPNETRLYIANTDGNSITVIDLPAGNQLAEIPVSAGPIALAHHPTNPRLYVACQTANTLDQINTGTLNVISSLNVGARPSGMAIRPGGAEVWVAIDQGRQINIVGTSGFTSTATIALSGQPQGIAITPDGQRAYAVLPQDRKVVVIDVAGRAVLTEFVVGEIPSSIAAALDNSAVFVVDRGAVEQIHILATQVAAPFLILRDSVRVRKQPSGLAVSANRVYVANSGSDEISVINPTVGQVGLDAHWRLGSGLGERVTWSLRLAGGAQAVLGSTTATHTKLKGESAGPLLVRAVYSLSDNADPYTFEVRLKPSLPANAVIRKDQYDLIMNILNAFHPIGVEVNTRGIRERVVEVREKLINAFPEYTYPNFKVRGPLPRPARKE